jgi:hypothetical protein
MLCMPPFRANGNLTEMQVQYQPMGPLQFSIAGFSPDSTTRLGLAKSREPFVV